MIRGNTIDWSKLKEQGRCKDIGIPWSLEEQEALRQGIPVDYVRLGFLTKEDYEEERKKDEEYKKKTGELPLEKLDTDIVRKKAKELGIEFTSTASKEVLIVAIRKKESSKKVTPKKKTAKSSKSKATKSKAKK